MISLVDLLDLPPFSISASAKRDIFRSELQELTHHHYLHCPEYKRIIDLMEFESRVAVDPENVPFLPVGIFKTHRLSSVASSSLVSTLNSSGTSGQQVSRISLDRGTANNQKKALARITADCIGDSRLPMLILDSAPSSATTDRTMISARTAGIFGFGNMGLDRTYAFDENMGIKFDVINDFLNRHRDKHVFVFGFTYIIWEHLVLPLSNMGRQFSIDNGTLIHGGGWKKLHDRSVDSAHFKRSVKNVTGITSIYNYYGMAEQAGSIFLECDQGHYHCSNFSDVFIRRNDLTLCDSAERGMIEVISLLPHSYPGHALLTEDVGTLLGEDDCPCGRLGKYFVVHGRIATSEIRGCGDTYQSSS